MGALDIIAGRPVATPHDQALAHAEHGVAIYWRPGCPYTARLRIAVRAHRQQARWVNIWEDEAGRAFVASVNGGDETVPTVVIHGVPHTNPAPKLVQAALSSWHGRSVGRSDYCASLRRLTSVKEWNRRCHAP